MNPETGGLVQVLEGGYHARFVPSGHIVYISSGVLMAAPFSLTRLEVRGPPVPVLEGVMTNPRTGAAYFAVSETGTLVYAPGDAVSLSEKRLVWVDRSGTVEPISEERRAFSFPRLSPDGARLAVANEAASDDIWIYELARGTFTRFTFEARNIAPLWTPDGRQLIFSSTVAGLPNLMIRPADASDAATSLVSTGFPSFAGSWTPDGKTLAFMGNIVDVNVFLTSIDETKEVAPFLDRRFREMCAAFSPDGRWLAYASDESGRSEVYVRPFPGPGGATQLSTDGGSEPDWAPSSDSRRQGCFSRRGSNQARFQDRRTSMWLGTVSVSSWSKGAEVATARHS